jgi:polysaccharide pyruvyl transferase WcaK-like protein
MLLTVVQECKEKYPDKDILLFTNDDKEYEKFKTLNFSVYFLNRYKSQISILKWKNKKMIDVLKNTSKCVDISWFALSSHFSNNINISYLLNIIICHKYWIRYYIYPQSIWPFNYSIFYKYFFKKLIKNILSYCDRIYIREQKLLNEFSAAIWINAEYSPDIVLLNDWLNRKILFNHNYSKPIPKIKNNSVGVIFNQKLYDKFNYDFDILYKNILDEIVRSWKIIYILPHSEEDKKICYRIADTTSEKMVIVDNQFSPLELEQIISNFDYMICSRYHWIIHWYKSGVTSLVLWWADKYNELTKLLWQEKYFIDLRWIDAIQNIDYKDLIKNLNMNYQEEKHVINHHLEIIKKEYKF